MSNQELLAKIGQSTDDETEFYQPMPTGYRKGKHKYVIVVGTVMSGLGKGIFSSSLAKLLQDKGLRVAPIKMEGYLNIDSGTLNPYRHGEVFVLDDGMETDMDLGTYERLLDQDLSALNFTTPRGTRRTRWASPNASHGGLRAFLAAVLGVCDRGLHKSQEHRLRTQRTARQLGMRLRAEEVRMHVLR